MKSTKCEKCGYIISNNSYQRHFNSCDGSGPTNHPQNTCYIKPTPNLTNSCNLCEFIGASLNSLKSHLYHVHSDKEKYHQDREKIKSILLKANTGRIAWNKGINFGN